MYADRIMLYIDRSINIIVVVVVVVVIVVVVCVRIEYLISILRWLSVNRVRLLIHCYYNRIIYISQPNQPGQQKNLTVAAANNNNNDRKMCKRNTHIYKTRTHTQIRA